MEALCCYGSEKRVQPVKIVFFPEPATSGGPGEDVWRGHSISAWELQSGMATTTTTILLSF